MLVRLEFSRQIFEKIFNVKFYENPPSGSRVISSGRTDRQTDRHNELIVAFRNALKNIFTRVLQNNFQNLFAGCNKLINNNVPRTGERRSAYRDFVGKHEGRNHLKDLGIDGRIILN